MSLRPGSRHRLAPSAPLLDENDGDSGRYEGDSGPYENDGDSGRYMYPESP